MKGNSIIQKMEFVGELPAVGSFARSAWHKWLYHYISTRWWLNAQQAPGTASIDPFRLLRVPPSSIEYRLKPEPFDRIECGKVVGGDWDCRRKHLIVDDILFDGLIARYKHGKPWSETDFYVMQQDRIKNGESAWGCSTLNELRTRYQKLDKVYESMKEEGYNPKKELIGERTVDALDEIFVCIGRQGELLFAGHGNHRIRLAKLLDVETVAVRVLVRHEEWQQIRNQIFQSESTSVEARVNPSHPDLQKH